MSPTLINHNVRGKSTDALFSVVTILNLYKYQSKGLFLTLPLTLNLSLYIIYWCVAALCRYRGDFESLSLSLSLSLGAPSSYREDLRVVCQSKNMKM